MERYRCELVAEEIENTMTEKAQTSTIKAQNNNEYKKAEEIVKERSFQEDLELISQASKDALNTISQSWQNINQEECHK